MATGFCKCGCGQPTLITSGRYRPLFIKSHRSWGRYHRKTLKKDITWYRTISLLGASKSLGLPSVRIQLHRLRAEIALGHPIPPQAIVYPVNGMTAGAGPLVICENKRYHGFLLARMRVKRAGGNPNTERICSTCHQLVAMTDFYRLKTAFGAHQVGDLTPRCKACSLARWEK